MKTKQELIREIAKILNVDEKDLGENSALGETANWDSFTHVEILLFIEQTFNIEINEQTIETYTNLSNILKLLNSDFKT